MFYCLIFAAVGTAWAEDSSAKTMANVSTSELSVTPPTLSSTPPNLTITPTILSTTQITTGGNDARTLHVEDGGNISTSICKGSSNTQVLQLPSKGVVEVRVDYSQRTRLSCFLKLFGPEDTFLSAVMESLTLKNVDGLDESVEMKLALEIRSHRHNMFVNRYTGKDFFPQVVPSMSNQMTFHFLRALDSHVTVLYLRLRFFVTSTPGGSILPQTALTPTTGYVTSFAFDGKTQYAREVSVRLALTVPADDVVMVSFPHFHLQESENCMKDRLMLLTRVQVGQEEPVEAVMWVKCGYEDIPPEIYSDTIVLHLLTDQSEGATGFKMFYSLHPKSDRLELHDDGFFDCLVPHYEAFQLHFHCNLERECDTYNDEWICPYISLECDFDFLDAGDKCYRYVTIKSDVMWYDAHARCESFGERLVSPQTPTEWQTLKNILKYGKKTFGIFVGLTTSSSNMAGTYREVPQWTDKTMAFYHNLEAESKMTKPICAYIPPVYTDTLKPIPCATPIYVHFLLCERDKVTPTGSEKQHLEPIVANLSTTMSKNVRFRDCPVGHVTWDFLSCERNADCDVTQYQLSCEMLGSRDVPMFVCDSGVQTLHYTKVCDHRHDCADGSDEEFCVFPACPERPCKNGQCVFEDDWCDGMEHCTDGSDETCLQFVSHISPSIPPPALVRLNGHGKYTIRALTPDNLCPLTHFRCPGGYCLPVYLRCNDVYDCTGREDELDCERYTCPGFYRCHGSRVCLHADHVCDGVFQCPQQDDELLCDLECPDACQCQGLAFVCNQTFSANLYPTLRYLDATSSGMSLMDVNANSLLIRLSLASCGMETIDSITLPNLRWLDLSANALTAVAMETFSGLQNLRLLRLADNPLMTLTDSGARTPHVHLQTLDLSLTQLRVYDGQVLVNYPRLKTLNMSHGDLTSITEGGFNSTAELQVLDVRHTPLDEFPYSLFQHLDSLQTVYASNFKLCCPATLPMTFNPNNCHAPVDEIASCDDLLRSDAYRGFLWVIATMATVGNIGGFVVRIVQKEAVKTGFHVFVTNLNMADCLMGVYLSIIGGADHVYRGRYLWFDKQWKGSGVCQAAGVLSLLSCEVSAMLICLITLDRFLVLRYPFSALHFRKYSALMASSVVWTVGCLLAASPLFPVTSTWKFYSQTGICIPLPFTRKSFTGQGYAFGVMVVFNFALFLLIAFGQVLIFSSIRKNTILSNQDTQEATIARRLTTIVVSDFLCWFPIGLLGLLASRGVPIASEVNVGVAIFVLPINSALNPFLYTFNVFMERRRKATENRLLQKLVQRATKLTSDTSKDRPQIKSFQNKETQTDLEIDIHPQ